MSNPPQKYRPPSSAMKTYLESDVAKNFEDYPDPYAVQAKGLHKQRPSRHKVATATSRASSRISEEYCGPALVLPAFEQIK